MLQCNFLLFNDFETLDAFGPVEVLGKLDKHFQVDFYSEKGGIVRSSQGVKVETEPISELQAEGSLLLIPGGMGTREEVNNEPLIQCIKDMCMKSQYVLSVCTGAALLAKTGLLKGLKATTNKMAFDWVAQQGRDVQWVRRARWVRDGKYYTSSGVTAGIDMALGFVSDRLGMETAERIAKGIEYVWNRDSECDPFA